jgi:predicted nucleic acid-binding protein
MATTGASADPVFVDTNVLIQATITAAPLHAVAVARLAALTGSGSELWISRQVLREYLATLSRPQSYTPALSAAALAADVTRFEAQFRIADDGPAVTGHLLTLIQAIPIGGKQVHDANIVATMLAHGLRRLVTHNTGDFARFGSLITIEPLVPTP